MKKKETAVSLHKAGIIIKYCLCAAAVFTVAATVLIFPHQSAEGVRNGLELCLKSVIPSLFPFMVISAFLVQSNMTAKADRFLSPVTRLLFRQPGCAGSVIFLSLIGGYPVGAGLVGQLYESKKITLSQGQRLLLFCINPGPAFVISCVGVQMLSSQKAGVILFASVTVSSLILGFLTRFMSDPPEEPVKTEKDSMGDLSQSFVLSAAKSTNSILMICGWVIIFSTVSALIKTAGLPDSAALFTDCILEVTNGCFNSIGVLPVSAIAGIIGWSGLCVHCQIMPALVRLKLNYKYFLTGRIICGALSCVICSFLLELFRVELPVMKLNCDSISAQKPEFLPVSLGLVILCAFIIIGDGLKIRIKSKKPLLK